MPYLSSIGVPRSSAGFIATAIPVISAVGRFGFGWLGDIFDRRYVMAAAYCLMGIGILAFAYVHLRWILFLFLLLFPVGYGGGNSLRGAIVAENFGTAHLGRVLGMMAGIIALGAAAGPVLAGWAFDSLGSYRLMWVASSLLLVPAIGLIVRIRPHTVGSI
jgi:MFS family permease